MITDQYAVNDIIYRTLENGNADANQTFATSMFDLSQVLNALNRIQQEFLLETGAIITRTTITGNVGNPKYALPVDSIRPYRLTWTDSSDSKTRALSQEDTLELDAGEDNWPANRDIPYAWWETTLPQQMVGLALIPSNNGTIGLLYVALAATLDGSGINFAVPDDFVPYLIWGTMAALLNGDGPAFDPVRAQYCEQRFQEGIELAKLILGG